MRKKQFIIGVKDMDSWLGCLALSVASCVTLDKFLNHSVSDFPIHKQADYWTFSLVSCEHCDNEYL